MTWLISAALMKDYENSLCLQELGEESLVENYLDGKQYAPLNVTHTQHKFWRNDRMMDVSNLSRFGLMCAALTESRGVDLLTWFRADSLARTSAQQAKAQELTENVAECGHKWQELLVRFCLDSSTWRTHQCLWDEDLPESSVTLPRWGMMRNGVLFQHPTLERPISATGYGYEPNDETFFHTPNTHGLDGGSNSRRALKKRKETFPTPLAKDSRGTDSPSDLRRHSPNMICVVRGGNKTLPKKLNPRWIEWLMGWPIGLSSLEPLAMVKFLSHMQQLGEYLAIKK